MADSTTTSTTVAAGGVFTSTESTSSVSATAVMGAVSSSSASSSSLNMAYDFSTGLINSVSGSSLTSSSKTASAEDLINKGKMANIQDGQEKLMKAKDGGCQVYVTKEYANMCSGDVGFEVSASGSIIAGPLDLNCTPHQIRIGGFWIFNEELLTTVPSTLFNPVQTLVYKDPPTAQRAGKLAKLLAGI